MSLSNLSEKCVIVDKLKFNFVFLLLTPAVCFSYEEHLFPSSPPSPIVILAKFTFLGHLLLG